MNCLICGRPFQWRGPGQEGVEQGWYRQSEETAKGRRCYDRNACKNAAKPPSLFP